METGKEMERRNGIALWRQIADSIRTDIGSGLYDGARKLTPELELARRYGVNRHTVREAIASLVHEGVLRSEQGRGTFIQQRRRFAYPIGPRTRFSTGLDGQAHELRGLLIAHAYEAASETVAAGLGIEPGARVLRLETLSEADGQPLSRSTSHFDASPLRRAGAGFRGDAVGHAVVPQIRHRRLSAALDSGVGAPCRRRRPRRPQTVAGSIVLVTVAINEDTAGVPVEFSESRFVASRIEFSIASQT